MNNNGQDKRPGSGDGRRKPGLRAETRASNFAIILGRQERSGRWHLPNLQVKVWGRGHVSAKAVTPRPPANSLEAHGGLRNGDEARRMVRPMPSVIGTGSRCPQGACPCEPWGWGGDKGTGVASWPHGGRQLARSERRWSESRPDPALTRPVGARGSCWRCPVAQCPRCSMPPAESPEPSSDAEGAAVPRVRSCPGRRCGFERGLSPCRCVLASLRPTPSGGRRHRPGRGKVAGVPNSVFRAGGPRHGAGRAGGSGPTFWDGC